MPSVKDPCVNCKEKHLRCDEHQPQCGRCLTRGLRCLRSRRKISFRPGSSAKYDAQFSGNQNWVSSNAREFRLQTPGGRPRILSQPTDPSLSREASLGSLLTNLSKDLGTTDTHLGFTQTAEADDGFQVHGVYSQKSPHSTNALMSLSLQGSPANSLSPESIRLQHTPGHVNYQHSPLNSVDQVYQQRSSPTEVGSVQGSEAIYHLQPFEDVQEACLWRYFTEELSHWFDLCDERKHFQLVVPIHARRYPPLLHAIFAVSARHLCRLPQYRTAQGIFYHGQLLPNITPNSAVEYMLTCIPALRQFHETEDAERREHIIATAVILRQFEEMEEDEDETDYSATIGENNHNGYTHERVNFLAIINAVVRSSNSESFFHRQGLFNATYWMAVRQEVYYAFTRSQSPQMLLASTLWHDATTVNKMVMHTAQVAKWLWDDKSEHEWLRLKEQESLLDQKVSGQYTPIFKRAADKSKGEVFPTIWYCSEIVVTGIQHLMIAKMVLIAESPFLNALGIHDARVANRKVETEVRLIILDLCGIALHHPRSPPALVNAAIGILLYGDFFTDQWEREALAGVIDRFKNVRAWPLPKGLRSFK